jgi:hypothetical protein
MVAPLPERMAMMKLDVIPFRAAPSVLVHEPTSPFVTLVDGTAHRRRDVAGLRPGIRVIGRPTRSRRSRKTPGLQPLGLLVDRALQDRGQIAVGDFRASERDQPLELFSKTRADRELNLVPPGR